MGGRVGIGGGGIGMIVIILIVSWLTGTNPLSLLQMAGGLPTGAPVERVPTGTAGDDPQSQFIGAVLGDLEDTWTQIFAKAGERYEPPVLVLFDGQVQSACGFASAASGPFYCPADRKVYLDLSFFRDLDQQFGAPGDFAQAYVVAHEVGHHVQTLLGVTQQVHAARRRASQAEGNALQVRLELQADCFAGVWAHHANKQRQVLEPGDTGEALAAAAGVGDDRLQRQTRGVVAPESFTHGSSEQRMRWFSRGMQSGDPGRCDTFKAARL